jgi:glycosidase
LCVSFQGGLSYSRKGGVNGVPINPGFAGDDARTPANFAQLNRADYAYTPFVPPAEANVKVPAWLNSPIYYHNRGNSDFSGESSLYGDFFGLDDLMTENPRVVQGFIDIYGAWIDRYGIDGFRIDTARHVNPEFWQAFVPAILTRARARGIPHFHIFGEVAAEGVDVAQLARHTRVDKLPSVLDFGFAGAVIKTIAGSDGTSCWRVSMKTTDCTKAVLRRPCAYPRSRAITTSAGSRGSFARRGRPRSTAKCSNA